MADNQLDELQLGVNYNDVLKANKQLDRLHNNVVRITRAGEKLAPIHKAYDKQASSVRKVQRETVNLTSFVKAYSKTNSEVTKDRKRQIADIRKAQRKQFLDLKRQYLEEQKLAKQTAANELRERKKVQRERDKLTKAQERSDKDSAERRLQTQKRVAAAMIASIAATALIVGKQSVEANELFEQSRINLETLSGSVEKGNALFAELVELTLETPFKLEETLTGAKRLLAMGVASEEVGKTLEHLGNIAAGVGREKLPQLILAYGQVRTATRLTGQELRQFQEAGVPLLDLLAKRSKKTASEIKEAMAKGVAPSFKEVQKAIEDATTGSGKFADLMRRQSRTLSGEVSKLQDAWTVFLNTVTGEFQDSAKSVVASIRSVLAELGQDSKTDSKRNQLNEVKKLVDLISDSSKATDLRVLAFSRLQEIAPKIAASFQKVEEYAKGFNVITTETTKDLEAQLKVLNATTELANVKFKISQKEAKLAKLQKDESDRSLGAELFKRGVDVGKDRLPLIHGAEKQKKDIAELINALDRLRKLRDAIQKQVPVRKTEKDGEDSVINTPKSLKSIAERFRSIDLETEQGVKTFQKAYDEKAEIISKFIDQSGVEASKLNDLFAGKLPLGNIGKKDAKTLTKGLRESTNTGTTEASDLQVTDTEKLLISHVDSKLKSNLKAHQKYYADLRALDSDRFLTEEESVRIQLARLQELEDGKVGITAASIDKRQQLESKLAKAQIRTWSSTMRSFGTIFGNLSSIVGSETRQAFEDSKNLAYGSATMNTAAGVMSALANNPDPISKWVDVAAVISTGIAQVASISKQKFDGGGGVDKTSEGAAVLRTTFGEDLGTNADTTNRLNAIRDATETGTDSQNPIDILQGGVEESNRILRNIETELKHQ